MTPPSTAEESIAVGASEATNEDNEIVHYSSLGPTVDGRQGIDFIAPTRVSVSDNNIFTGTSAAAPHVAGALALIDDQNGTATQSEVLERFHQTTSQAGVELTDPEQIGSGYINVSNAAVPKSPTETTSVDVLNIDSESDATFEVELDESVYTTDATLYLTATDGETVVEDEYEVTTSEMGESITRDIDLRELGDGSVSVVASAYVDTWSHEDDGAEVTAEKNTVRPVAQSAGEIDDFNVLNTNTRDDTVAVSLTFDEDMDTESGVDISIDGADVETSVNHLPRRERRGLSVNSRSIH